jgi:Fe2+ or Zn2+ uptake regulation protein
MERTTHQKQAVLGVMKSLRGQHPTAETVYEYVAKDIPSISKATVYRILNRFAEQGALLRIHTPMPGADLLSGDHYDDTVTPHSHMMCNSCKRVIDVSVPQFENIVLPQTDSFGCRITGVEVMFVGVCRECDGICHDNISPLLRESL